jgi:hypothetical protein
MQKNKKLIEHIDQNKLKYFWMFFIIGLNNHIGYWTITTASKHLSEKYNKKSFMGTFTFSLSVTLIYSKMFNS